MNHTDKDFDAVAMMRQIRDQLSQQFQHLTLAEQQQYIRSQINLSRAFRNQKNVTQDSHYDSNQRL